MNRYFPKQDTDVQRFCVTNHQGNAPSPQGAPLTPALLRLSPGTRTCWMWVRGRGALLAKAQPGGGHRRKQHGEKRTSR